MDISLFWLVSTGLTAFIASAHEDNVRRHRGRSRVFSIAV
jgi:hypothetical protein